MTLNEIITRVRSYTRDTTGTLFTASDVKDFANEGIDKLRQIKALEGMEYLENDSDVPALLPSNYHYSIAMYSASRCFLQDEQHYASQTFMDEFTALYNLIELGIKEGTIVITDKEGNSITDDKEFDGVTNVYFGRD